uniref:Akirin n=1 Tax=Panagrellus redivivus TaxID=6233 RepID=A0A7E4VXQ2_PANRE
MFPPVRSVSQYRHFHPIAVARRQTNDIDDDRVLRYCRVHPHFFLLSQYISPCFSPFRFRPWSESMTCGLAVKRPHDYEAYLGSEGVDAKRARPTNAHCSPFRPQLGTLAASLPHSNTLNMLRNDRENDQSPFASVSGKYQLSSSQLDSYLNAEIKYLKRRKLIPKRPSANMSCAMAAAAAGGSSGYRRTPGSPNSMHSGSDSEGETSSSKDNNAMQLLYSAPSFSLNQVKLICERLLKQQEVQLRHEYETALNKKLEEQYDQYCQFATEQAQRPTNSDMSYCN